MKVASIGQRLPSTRLARVRSGTELELLPLEALLQGRRVLVVGLPGAFTPVCSKQHVPALVEKADALKGAGIDEILVIAPDSPWVVEEWAKASDPGGKLTFLSDGNLEFVRMTGLVTYSLELFLGESSKRYTMILQDGVIEQLFVEDRIDVVNCTHPALLLT